MDLELTLEPREAQGKANKRLRRTGMVPGVVFGKGEDSVPVQVEAKTFETLYRAAGRTSVVKFRVPGASRAKSGIIKSVQRHPLTGNALHVDYFLVNLRQEMEIEVPIVIAGEAPAVAATGGTLLHNISSVIVRALPNDIPHELTVDVSVLETLDDAVRVRDLPIDTEKVHFVTDPETVIATVVPPRVEVEEEVVSEEEAEAEVEAAAEAGGTEAAPETEESGEESGSES